MMCMGIEDDATTQRLNDETRIPMRMVVMLFVLPVLLWAAVASFTGKCVGISDGDTIKVLKNGVETKIRLYGVDCPEKKQDYGTKAKEFTADFCFGKTVRVDEKGTDRYGRVIGEVFVDGVSLNRALVENGFAWWYVQYAKKDADLGVLEEKARKAKKGLWAGSSPVEPWEFRRK